MPNQQLAEELLKQIIRKFEKKSTPIYIHNIWSAYLADKQLINKFHKGFQFFVLPYWHLQ